MAPPTQRPEGRRAKQPRGRTAAKSTAARLKPVEARRARPLRRRAPGRPSSRSGLPGSRPGPPCTHRGTGLASVARPTLATKAWHVALAPSPSRKRLDAAPGMAERAGPTVPPRRMKRVNPVRPAAPRARGSAAARRRCCSLATVGGKSRPASRHWVPRAPGKAGRDADPRARRPAVGRPDQMGRGVPNEGEVSTCVVSLSPRRCPPASPLPLGPTTRARSSGPASVVVSHAWMVANADMAHATGVYLTLDNRGDAADRLTGAAVEFADHAAFQAQTWARGRHPRSPGHRRRRGPAGAGPHLCSPAWRGSSCRA